MRRYIDADVLRKNEIARCHCVPCVGSNDNNYKDLDEVLNDTPTADVVEVVHAYWKATTHITESKRNREIHSKLYNCSNCDAPNGRKKSSYCHWCGAKMDGERSENGKS